MKAVDDCGRIQLPDSLRAALGIKPGDAVTLEEQSGGWMIHAANDKSGLGLEVNVLVHHGKQTQPVEGILERLCEERITHMTEGLAE